MHKSNHRARLTTKWDVLQLASHLCALVNYLLRITGRLKILHRERFPKNPEPILLIANHPTFTVETVLLLPGLFTNWAWKDRRHIAWNVPDAHNFRVFKHRFLSWLLLRTVFVPRTGRACDQLASIEQIIERLNAGESVILLPEGARTSTGNVERLSSASGKQLRRIQKAGFGRIAYGFKGTILPVWVNGAENVLPRGKWIPRLWRKMSLVIGNPVDLSELRAKNGVHKQQFYREATRLAQDALLALADETA